MTKITPNIMRIVIILVYRFENPAAEGIVFFEVVGRSEVRDVGVDYGLLACG